MTESLLYHLAEKRVWMAQQKSAVYQPAEFEKEGFVHASTRAQLRATARRYYAGREDMLVLLVATEGLPVVYENLLGGAESFPHIYAPLPKSAVKHVFPLYFEDGDFDWTKSLPPDLRPL